MKKQLSLLLMFTLMFLGSACSDDDEKVPVYEFLIEEELLTLTPPALGESYSIPVTSSQNNTRIDFEVVSFPEWALSTKDLTGLTIEVQENINRVKREGSVIIKQLTSKKSIEIKIIQQEVEDNASLKESFNASTYKVLSIEPTIIGYSNSPQYRWTDITTDDKPITLGEAKDLPFIVEKAGTYKLKFHIKDGNIEQTLYTEVIVGQPEEPYSEKIAKVFEYKPAPGWKLNEHGFSAGDTNESINNKIEALLKEEKTLRLGDFGGHIIFGFDHTIINKEGLRDFRITSSTNKGNNTRPGIIMVSFDANGNGKPDDEWYEIAGSEYHNVQTIHGLDITYYKPTKPLESYKPGDNYLKFDLKNKIDSTGYILKKFNGMGADAIYPLWYRGKLEEEVSFTNLTRLPSTIVMNGMFPDQSSDKNYKPFEYGYACNLPNSDKIGTAIDISWAVDTKGNKVNLPGIDFVKVYTGTFAERGLMYGEPNSDIQGAFDLHMLGEEIKTIDNE